MFEGSAEDLAYALRGVEAVVERTAAVVQNPPWMTTATMPLNEALAEDLAEHGWEAWIIE